MDILYFLNERTHFIRSFYDTAADGFLSIMRKVEAGDEPYVPPYSEDPEPPFLSEWLEANEALEVLGQCSVSLLATTLHLYCREFTDRVHSRYTNLRELGIVGPDRKIAAKDGWINANRVFFGDELKIPWDRSGANLDVLEQIVLARNSAQHPTTITSHHIEQTPRDYEKYRHPFFADDMERQLFRSGVRPEDEWLMGPWRLNVTKEKLFHAIDEVEHLCKYVEAAWDKWPNVEFKAHLRSRPRPTVKKGPKAPRR